ncbi:hypothetical protein DKX38_019556 [Salix brachista]|uniref:Uncharacterized protein n=1 Tax=Salix brachista TaxID=2182728 RepID=A0A5N5KGL2_9ROSI|nr:hypothetical protein DKX38_019556 [Salix brachista]
MNKILNLIVFMLLPGLMILSPPTGGTHMVQAYDTADRQAALETTSSRNWNFPRKLKLAYLLEKLKGMKLADIFTKDLSRDRFCLKSELNIIR